VVATRPTEANGLGLDLAKALANVEEFSRCVGLLEETAEVSRELRLLLGRHVISGKRIHDAHIVATMLVHGLKQLATDNVTDFEVFPEIRVDGLGLNEDDRRNQ
jgi:predicted nucleic acid-binding protein